MEMNKKNRFCMVSYWFYNLTYLFLVIRTFLFGRGIGHGLGDVFFVVLYTLYFILQLILYKYIKNSIFIILLTVLNITIAIFILLKIYVFYGPEVSYQWHQGLWCW